MSARVLSLMSPQIATLTENERLPVAANYRQCERPFFSSQWEKYSGGNVMSCWQLCQFSVIYLSNFPRLKNEIAAKINETSSGFSSTELGADCFFPHFLSDSLTFFTKYHEMSGGAHLSCVWQPAGGGINQGSVCFILLHSSGWTAALFSYLQHTKCTHIGGLK